MQTAYWAFSRACSNELRNLAVKLQLLSPTATRAPTRSRNSAFPTAVSRLDSNLSFLLDPSPQSSQCYCDFNFSQFSPDGRRERGLGLPEREDRKFALQIPLSSLQTVYSQFIRPELFRVCAIIIQLIILQAQTLIKWGSTSFKLYKVVQIKGCPSNVSFPPSFG